MNRWAGKVALVTGASSGIGAAIVRALAKNGVKVIAAARRYDKLQQLAANIKQEYKIDVYPMACDVQKEEDILNVFEWAESTLGGVDVLINNAGLLSYETIIEGSTETYRKIMDINVLAAAICSRELTRSVKKRNASGHIVIINSVIGHYAESISFPVSMYAASKYALTGMVHSLRNELVATKLDIKVTSVSPGVVDTYMPNSNFPQQILKNLPMLKDKDIADAVIYVLGAPSDNTQICELIVSPKGTAVIPRSAPSN